MAGIKEIKEKCKAGQVKEAYDLAKADLEAGQPWGQLTTGWALRYLIEEDARNGRYDQLMSHLNELQSFDQIPEDEIDKIFDRIVFWIGYIAKKYFPEKDINTPGRLSTLFSKVKKYTFKPGVGYSMLLEGFIRCDAWPEMLDFFKWWNLDNLTPEDFKPIELPNGRTIQITLAERAYIANSKALLRLNDPGLIEEFLPQLDSLMNEHPEMTYPGYFYGKLLLALGTTPEDALKVIVPFARKKATEFWVWQLISDVFINDQEKQLACLLRAVNCRTQENFLGKVRIKLADLYIKMNKLDLAKNQIDKVTKNYLQNGWRLPSEIDTWIHQSWFNSVPSNDHESLDYMTITNAILCEGTEEAIAIVTYVDQNSHKVSMVYGYEKRLAQKLRIKVKPGTILKINYIQDPDGKVRIMSSANCQIPSDLNYGKLVEGIIKKRDDWNFAFLHYGNEKAFVSPNIVSKFQISNGENVSSLIVYDFDKKKDSWNWVSITINRK